MTLNPAVVYTLIGYYHLDNRENNKQMGFFKKLFSDEEEVSEEIKAARERHGIQTGEVIVPESENVDEAGRRRWEKRLDKPANEVYDPWEQVREVRYQFFVGGLYRRHPRPETNHDAIRKELEEATRKREELYQQKQAEKQRKKEEKERKKRGV